MKMTDHSKMSDFEINCQVAFHIGLRTVERAEAGEFNPCSNPADAWPIIINNKISIMQEIKGDCAAFGGFSMHHSGQADWDICARDKNPLRAAMIVFLMMQEDKK